MVKDSLLINISVISVRPEKLKIHNSAFSNFPLKINSPPFEIEVAKTFPSLPDFKDSFVLSFSPMIFAFISKPFIF